MSPTQSEPETEPAAPARHSWIAVLLDPAARRQSPPAMQVDLRPVIWTGIGAWTLALLVFIVLEIAQPSRSSDGVAVSLCGICLGLVGFIWEHANRRQYRALGSRRAARASAAADADPAAREDSGN